MAKTKPGSPERAAISEQIFAGMRSGMTSYKACEIAGISQSAFIQWTYVDEEMAKAYAHAREDLVERMANEIVEISDADVEYTPDGKKDWAAVQKHRLQVDTRKWLLSKLAPKKYGDKLEHSGPNGGPIVFGWKAPDGDSTED